MCTVVHSASCEHILSVCTESSRLCACGDYDRLCKVFVTGAFYFLYIRIKLYRNDLVVFGFRTEPVRALLHLHTKREAVYSRFEAGIIVNISGKRHLPSGRHSLYKQGFKPCACAVKRGGISRRTSADNYHIVNFSHNLLRFQS